MPQPPMTLTFELLTLKMVYNVRQAHFNLPIGLSVLDLGPM